MVYRIVMADSSDCGAEVAESRPYGCCDYPALQARLTTKELDSDPKHFEQSVGSARDTSYASLERLLASKQLTFPKRRILSELPNTP